MEVIISQVIANFDKKADSLFEMLAMERSSNQLVIGEVQFLEVEESTFECFDIKVINDSFVKCCLSFLES